MLNLNWILCGFNNLSIFTTILLLQYTRSDSSRKIEETASCNGTHTIKLAFLVWQSNNLEHAHSNLENKKLHAVLVLGDAVN